MANLSNINNKFLFTDGDFLKIGNLAPINNISGTESGISITNGNVASIALDNTAASGKTFVIYSDDGGKLNFYDVDASSGRLVIDSSGRVGINDTVSGNFTTNYDTKLLVGGEIIARSLTASASMISIGGDATSAFIKVGKQDGSLTARPLRIEVGTSEAMRIDSSGNVLINATSKYNIYPAGFITETIATDAGDVCPILELVGNRSANPGNQNAMIQFFNKTSTAVEVGRIASSQGSATNSGELRFYTTYAGIISQRMIIDSSGNVGINDTNPNTANLSIKGQSSGVSANFPMLKLLGQNTSSDGLHITTTGSGNDHYAIKVATGGNSSAFNVTNAGNVGIGITSPSAPLDISSNSNSSDNIIELINTKYGSTDTTGETGILFGWSNHSAARIAAFKEGTVNRTGFNIIGEAGYNVPTTIATFRSTGRVGIGITLPSTTLHVDAGQNLGSLTNNVAVYIGGGFVNNDLYHREGGLLVISGTNATQTSAGIAFQTRNTNNTNYWKSSILMNRGGELEFYTGGAGTGQGSERVRITSGGYFKASNSGTIPTSNAHELVSNYNGGQIAQFTHSGSIPYGMQIKYSNASPNTTDNYFFLGTDSTANRIIVWGNGNVQNQNNSYGAISDIKLKENIVDATPKLDDLMKVKVRNYNLIGDDKKQIGVVAQELENIFPNMIDESIDYEYKKIEDKEGNITEENIDLGTTTKSVKYSVFIPMLIKSIQELKTDNDSLKARIETLENK